MSKRFLNPYKTRKSRPLSRRRRSRGKTRGRSRRSKTFRNVRNFRAASSTSSSDEKINVPTEEVNVYILHPLFIILCSLRIKSIDETNYEQYLQNTEYRDLLFYGHMFLEIGDTTYSFLPTETEITSGVYVGEVQQHTYVQNLFENEYLTKWKLGPVNQETKNKLIYAIEEHPTKYYQMTGNAMNKNTYNCISWVQSVLAKDPTLKTEFMKLARIRANNSAIPAMMYIEPTVNLTQIAKQELNREKLDEQKIEEIVRELNEIETNHFTQLRDARFFQI